MEKVISTWKRFFYFVTKDAIYAFSSFTLTHRAHCQSLGLFGGNKL